MKTLLSGLMATALAATFAAAMPMPAKADQVYIGDSGSVYVSDRDWRGHRMHRHHWRAYRNYDSYDPYYYRSYHGFGAYDGPRYYRHHYYRNYYRPYRPGLTLQFGWH